MSPLLHDRIDTHIHFIPPSFASALQAAKTDPYTGYPVPQFSIPELFAALKELDVQTAVLSVTTPGPPIAGSGPEGRELARKCNDEGMELVRQGEGRFKFFGSTPCWTDVQGTIDEIEYCLVTLKCPGIVCLSSYGDRLLGDPLFKPIWDKLDALHAVVFIHPTGATIIPERIASFVPQGIVDFPQQTTRTAVDLVFTGTLQEHPNVKPILSHSGGTLPYLSERICGLGADVAVATQGLDKDSMYDLPHFHVVCKSDETMMSSVSDFRRFWFDVAIGTTRSQLIGLLAFTTPDKVLYGSDWPYLPLEHGKRYRQMLDEFLDSPEGESLSGVIRENALKLFGWEN